MSIYYVSLATAILLGVGGQIALKAAAERAPTIAAQLTSPLTGAGFAIYVVAALCYIVALKRIPVSLAFPSVSASYAAVAILAHILWGEPFGWPQIGGVLLIGAGIVLIQQH
jgi:small multidrug resistance pump